MDKELLDYIKKDFQVLEHEEYYHALCRDFRKFIRLRWDRDKRLNHHSIEIYTCYNGSTIETSKFIGIPNVSNIESFKKSFKETYINEYGLIRWTARCVFKPFFKYMRCKKSPYYA